MAEEINNTNDINNSQDDFNVKRIGSLVTDVSSVGRYVVDNSVNVSQFQDVTNNIESITSCINNLSRLKFDANINDLILGITSNVDYIGTLIDKVFNITSNINTPEQSDVELLQAYCGYTENIIGIVNKFNEDNLADDFDNDSILINDRTINYITTFKSSEYFIKTVMSSMQNQVKLLKSYTTGDIVNTAFGENYTLPASKIWDDEKHAWVENPAAQKPVNIYQYISEIIKRTTGSINDIFKSTLSTNSDTNILKSYINTNKLFIMYEMMLPSIVKHVMKIQNEMITLANTDLIKPSEQTNVINNMFSSIDNILSILTKDHSIVSEYINALFTIQLMKGIVKQIQAPINMLIEYCNTLDIKDKESFNVLLNIIKNVDEIIDILVLASLKSVAIKPLLRVLKSGMIDIIHTFNEISAEINKDTDNTKTLLAFISGVHEIVKKVTKLSLFATAMAPIVSIGLIAVNTMIVSLMFTYRHFLQFEKLLNRIVNRIIKIGFIISTLHPFILAAFVFIGLMLSHIHELTIYLTDKNFTKPLGKAYNVANYIFKLFGLLSLTLLILGGIGTFMIMGGFILVPLALASILLFVLASRTILSVVSKIQVKDLLISLLLMGMMALFMLTTSYVVGVLAEMGQYKQTDILWGCLAMLEVVLLTAAVAAIGALITPIAPFALLGMVIMLGLMGLMALMMMSTVSVAKDAVELNNVVGSQPNLWENLSNNILGLINAMFNVVTGGADGVFGSVIGAGKMMAKLATITAACAMIAGIGAAIVPVINAVHAAANMTFTDASGNKTKLLNSDLNKLGPNLETILTCLFTGISDAIAKNPEAFEDPLIGDSPIKVAMDCMGKIGQGLSGIVDGIMKMAKMSVKDPITGKTVTLSNTDFTKAGENIQTILTCLYTGISDAIAKNPEAFEDPLIGDSPIKVAIDNMGKLGTMLGSIMDGINKINGYDITTLNSVKNKAGEIFGAVSEMLSMSVGNGILDINNKQIDFEDLFDDFEDVWTNGRIDNINNMLTVLERIKTTEDKIGETVKDNNENMQRFNLIKSIFGGIDNESLSSWGKWNDIVGELSEKLKLVCEQLENMGEILEDNENTMGDFCANVIGLVQKGTASNLFPQNQAQNVTASVSSQNESTKSESKMSSEVKSLLDGIKSALSNIENKINSGVPVKTNPGISLNFKTI